jgi:hypothetical protein
VKPNGTPAGERPGPGALPNLVVIGAMKCGTTSLHAYLDAHPQIAMSRPKELNFFFGPDEGADWSAGNWHRGRDWYAAHFDAGAAVRGEASPGYTSPDHPEVAARMAELVPGARLVYAVRDPIDRALSQYWHHRRDGTETRGPAEALLDPASQYVARGRYLERLEPFLATGAFDGRIAVVAQEHLRDRPRPTVRRLFAWLGVDDNHWSAAMEERRNAAPERPAPVDAAVRQRLCAELRDDADRLREFTGEAFAAWSV